MSCIHQDRASLAAPVTGKIYEGTVARIHPADDPLRYGPDRAECRDMAGLLEILAELQTSKPFTLLHPDDLISRGARADIVGRVISARIDGDFVVAQILVTDPRGEAAIADGMHELSLGYTSVLRDGNWQSQIKIDHLSLVPRGRCQTCALRADCAESCSCKSRAMSYTTGTVADQPKSDVVIPAGSSADATVLSATPQRNLAMDELSKKLGEALAEAAAQKARADQLDTDLKATKKALTDSEVAATNAQAALNTEKTRADAAIATEKARADAADAGAKAALEKSKLDAVSDLATAVKTRVALETQANRILGSVDKDNKPVDRSALSDRDIKVAVIKHVDNLDVAPEKEEAFVDGVYTGSLNRSTSVTTSVAAVRTALEQTRADAKTNLPVLTGLDAERQARQDMANRKRNGRA